MSEGIKKSPEAVAETIENNVRKLIIDESPINPKYCEKMSELLDALIALRKAAALDYAAYLAKIVELTKQAKNGPGGAAYPSSLNTPAKKALHDNLGKDEALALAVDAAVRKNAQAGWRDDNIFKIRKIRKAIQDALYPEDAQFGALHDIAPEAKAKQQAVVDRILELVKKQNEY